MLGLWIVIFTRVISAVLILRFPVFGYLLSIFFDLTDLWIFEIFNSTFGVHYHIIDKILDMLMFIFAFIVSRKFDILSKNIIRGLFIWRIIGTIIFEVTKVRWIFFIFANIFENFYLFTAIRIKHFPKFSFTKKNAWWILILLAIPKLYHEWFLHISGKDMLVYQWTLRQIEKFGLRVQ